MSNLDTVTQGDCATRGAYSAISLVIEPRIKDLGGFNVRRLLPVAKRRMVGPWIFFDHMGPADFPPGEGIDVRPHPHINLATVTYLFDGEILHRDSVGSQQAIKPGDINLMVAGRGIVHSERSSPKIKASGQRLHALQLWLALPTSQEEIDPAFYHYPAAELPQVDVDGVAVRVMMGSAYGVTSPVKTFARTLYAEADLKAGQSLVLHDETAYEQERAVYIAKGQLTTMDSSLPEYTMTVFNPHPGVRLEAVEDSRIAIIGGQKLAERYIDWNFVSSRKERIEQAKADWHEGKFDKVPGDDKEFIPLPG